MDVSKFKRSIPKIAAHVLVCVFLCLAVSLACSCFAQKAHAQDRADCINASALSPISADGGTWVHGSKGWWYRYSNGSYPANTWAIIANKIYHFDSSGWMSANWLSYNGTWYYLGGDGALKTGWQKVKGTWYYLDSNAAMLTGKRTIDNVIYYLDPSGAMKTGWNLEGEDWHYYRSSGAMACGWLKLGSTWYYLDGAGVMQTGKLTINGKLYRFADSGAMRTGWVKETPGWVYYGPSGSMYISQWAGNYYLGKNGVMVTDSWVDSGRYYVGITGEWAPNKLVTYSKNGSVFHIVDGCPQALKIKDPQLIAHSAAKAKGLTLCKTCQSRLS